jgi:LemA protein
MGVMLIVLAVAAVAAVGLAAYAVGLYNQLVHVRVNVDKAWSNIDVLEKQRYDEIPRLVTVCEAYMKHERETLERVIRARTSYLDAKAPGAVAEAGGMLSGALKSLFALSEQYPDLKANQNFLQLKSRITDLENQIADRREFYNESVTLNNTRMQQFPDLLLVGVARLAPRELYRVPPEEKKPPEIKFS